MAVINKLIKIRFPMFDRNHGDHELITDAFSKGWGEITTVLSEIKLESPYGIIDINFKWGEHISKIKENNIQNYFTIEDYLYGKFTDEEFSKIVIDEKFIDLECIISIDHIDKNCVHLTEKEDRVIPYYVENILFHVFLAMNLSTPGSFNCFSRELQARSELEIYEYSSSCIESAWIESINNGWPRIDKLELSDVWFWLQSLQFGYRQIAQNRTERALFSILYLCKEDRVDPTQLIWISLALEALYDTPKAQINKTLLERIFLFLGIPEDNRSIFKKKIRELYDLRSRFVHGELDIATPLSNEILDNKCNEYEATIIEYCDFGLSIIIATLQKMIQNQWKTVNFKESYYGEV